MSADERGGRRPPSARFAGAEHLFGLGRMAEVLRDETNPVRDGHRQMTIFHKGPLTIVFFDFEAGGALADHSADAQVMIMALSGLLVVSTPSDSHHLAAPSLLVLDPGVRHDVHAPVDSQVLLVVNRSGGPTP